MVRENIIRLTQRIVAACKRAGRNPQEITVIAVSKHRPLQDIKESLEEGICDIGENRVQEALMKYASMSSDCKPATRIRWHMVGHLQSNKAKEAVRIFDLIHSVDSMHLAQEIDAQSSKINKIQQVLLQVNISGEKMKYGFNPEDLKRGIRGIVGLTHLTVKGVMTMAPIVQDPQEARPYFRRLRELLQEINSMLGTQYSVHELSMGMSDDFEAAIEEGATMIRIGRAIFGG